MQEKYKLCTKIKHIIIIIVKVLNNGTNPLFSVTEAANLHQLCKHFTTVVLHIHFRIHWYYVNSVLSSGS